MLSTPGWAIPSAIGMAMRVVDTVGFSDRVWLDADGHARTI
jgi:hypothetical protein